MPFELNLTQKHSIINSQADEMIIQYLHNTQYRSSHIAVQYAYLEMAGTNCVAFVIFRHLIVRQHNNNNNNNNNNNHTHILIKNHEHSKNVRMNAQI